jgi:radical SAM superfamily enzyme YgiQ (UPF0313 family)
VRVTLVYPFFGTGRRSLYFPQGLAYVAAALRKAGHEITVVDMEGNDLSTDAALARILESSPDMVGFGGMITRYKIVRELGRNLKREAPGIFLMAGNSGATTIPGLYLESARMDAVVLGEGEATSVELAGAVSSGTQWRSVPGIAFLDGSGSVARSGERGLHPDLDSLPWPARDLFPLERYMTSMDHRGKHERHLEIVASRGCPFGCSYCYHIYGRTIRRRSPEAVVAEAEHIVKTYGVMYTGFPDDLFTSDKAFVLKVCRLFRERLPGIRWSCIGRASTVDMEMLSAMREAGCDWISYGVETGSPEILRRMNRTVTPEQCLGAVRMTREAGIFPEASFMIGMFGETRETVSQTVRFCHEADITAPMLFVTPYPGTPLFREAEQRGLIPDLETYVLSLEAADRLLVNLTDMDDGELMELRKWAMGAVGRRYLLRRPFTRIPALLWKHLALRGWDQLKRDAGEFLSGFGRRPVR